MGWPQSGDGLFITVISPHTAQVHLLLNLDGDTPRLLFANLSLHIYIVRSRGSPPVSQAWLAGLRLGATENWDKRKACSSVWSLSSTVHWPCLCQLGGAFNGGLGCESKRTNSSFLLDRRHGGKLRLSAIKQKPLTAFVGIGWVFKQA